jgi:hypothetical protein
MIEQKLQSYVHRLEDDEIRLPDRSARVLPVALCSGFTNERDDAFEVHFGR